MLKFFCFLISLISFNFSFSQPLALHPSNPHYFIYRDKPAVLITSGEHYGAVLNLDFNYRKYLDELHSDHLNMTRIFSGVYCEQPGAFNIKNNTLAPLPNRYLTPWARSETPGYKNGGNKFDLTKWDEKYFSRLKDFFKEASSRDIIVEFAIFCPFYEDGMWALSPMNPVNNVNSTPDIARTDVYTLDKNGALIDIQKTLVKKLVTELNEFDNIIFEICNEPYFGGVTMEWQHAIADVIIETEKSLPQKHLVSQNIQNGASVVSDPHLGVSVFNWHYAYPPVTVGYNYGLNKVIGDNETGFRGVSDSTYRFEGWRFMIAGGALFNHLDYSFTPGHESGDNRYDSTTPGGGSDALRKQFSYLKKFVESFDYIKMKPDSTLLGNLRGNALVEDGKQYAIYLVDDGTASLDLNIPDGNYHVSFLHPLSGKYEKAKSVSCTGNKLVLSLPPHKQDLAIKILRK